MAGRKSTAVVWMKKSKVRWGILSGIWLALVVLVVVPTWQGVVQRNNEIKDLEVRLATMDDWTVAGMWLTPSVKQRTLPVNAAFRRLFPAQRRRESLFLSLAQVADRSGVEDFSLSEATDSGMTGNDVWDDGTSMAEDQSAPPPTDGGMGAMGDEMALEIPKVELSPYRVNACFSGDYQRVARFMMGLKNIERALKVNSLVIRPGRDGIQVQLELDVYVSKTSQS
jgi:hypothetical protein